MENVTLITKLAETGTLGILLGLSLYALVGVYKKLIEEKDKRIDDAKEVTKSVVITLDKNTDALKGIEMKLTKIEDDSTRYHNGK